MEKENLKKKHDWIIGRAKGKGDWWGEGKIIGKGKTIGC